MAEAIDNLETGGGTPTLQAKTNIAPTESSQTITADSGYDGLSSVQINAISSSYVGSGVTRRSSSDLSTSGATVTAPAGYYASDASISVASFPDIGAINTYTLSELFYGISHNEYSTGTVTPTSYYPTGSESLFCDTGFSGTLGGILIFDTQNPSVSGASYPLQQCMGAFSINNSSSTNQTETSRGFWKAGTSAGTKMFGNRMSSYRVNDGKLYIKPAYATLNNSYFMLNHTYRWIAWKGYNT